MSCRVLPHPEVRPRVHHGRLGLPLFRLDVEALDAIQDGVGPVILGETPDAEHVRRRGQPDARVIAPVLRIGSGIGSGVGLHWFGFGRERERQRKTREAEIPNTSTAGDDDQIKRLTCFGLTTTAMILTNVAVFLKSY